MGIRTRIVAGTAIGLVLAAAQATASPSTGPLTPAQAQAPAVELLAQSQLPLRRDGTAREADEAQQETEEEPPAEAVDEPPPPPAQPKPAPQPEPEPAPQPEPEPEEAPDLPQEVEPTPEEVPLPETAPEQDPAPVPEVEPAPEPSQPPQELPEEQPAPPADAPERPPAQTPDLVQEPEERPADEAPDADIELEPASGSAAPILDSDKEADEADAAGDEPAVAAPAEDTGPPPQSDEEARREAAPVDVRPLREEEGRRVERQERPRERREGSDILREIGDRVLIGLGSQVVVQSSDEGRLARGATEVYYEELPRGRSRETIVRPDGSEVVTVRDRYGDIVQRSRITPDGREHVLVYSDDRERDRDGPRQWRDPGRDLPPLRLRIPADEYILDARRARDSDAYYEFLHQPPVERVRRLYSVDEVRYSARIRDSVRRVDLDTITFDFGAASISESEIERLDSVAFAIERLIEENPAETFLIEGHTDAVGSDLANLALSDRRAEAVATALTDVFDIPPENLVTQGYGERYLKIDTQEPERLNRRVAVRRITPLVAPLASAQ